LAVKIICGLGKGRYTETIYGFQRDGSFQPIAIPGAEGNKTRLCAVAVVRHLIDTGVVTDRPEMLLIGPSDTIEWAKQAGPWPEGSSVDGSGPSIWEELSAVAEIMPLPMAAYDEMTSANLWEMFGLLAERLEPGDAVAFDITNSFRMFPFLAMLAVAFLRVVRGITMQGIYYGNFQPNEPTTEIMELGSFVDLLDWTTAAERFINAGDGRPLADILTKTAAEDQKRGLGNHIGLTAAAETVEHLSEAVLMAQAVDSMDKARNISSLTTRETFSGTNVPKYVPLEMLLQKTRSAFSNLNVAEAREFENRHKSMNAQVNLLRWYVKSNLWVQALQLAREVIISKTCIVYGLDMNNCYERSRNGRVEAARLLNASLNWKFQSQSTPGALPPTELKPFMSAPDIEGLITLWGQAEKFGNDWQIDLPQLRNAVAHAGFFPHKLSGSQIKQLAENLIAGVLSYFDPRPKS